MNKVKFVLFSAGLLLALGFVFGCSSDEGGGGSGGNGSLSSGSNNGHSNSSSSVVGISSSGGGNSDGNSSLSSSNNGVSNHSSSSSTGISSSGGGSSSGNSSSSSIGQSSSTVLHECDAIFNPDNKFCYDGVVYDKCGGNSYNPVTQGCLSGKVGEKCGNNLYIQATQFCYDGNIYAKCDGMVYSPVTHICQNKVAIPAKCGGDGYNPLTQDCCNGTIFSKTTQSCCNNSAIFSITAQYCLAGEIVDTKCGNSWYSQTTQFCVDDRVYTKCNGMVYSPVTHYCKNGVVCGPTDPTIDTRDGKEYKTTVIGTQIWMAENLNYNTTGSKCYSNDETNCATYGRLYGWTMAMELPTTCNSSICASQIDTKHQGICPSGWHLPSRTEWSVLMKFVNPSCSATCNEAYSLNDDFSGRRMGGKSQNGNFFEKDTYDYWWSSSEGGNASATIFQFDGRDARITDKSKSYELYSVRCLKD